MVVQSQGFCVDTSYADMKKYRYNLNRFIKCLNFKISDITLNVYFYS